jgi:hypothetical protein
MFTLLTLLWCAVYVGGGQGDSHAGFPGRFNQGLEAKPVRIH